MKKKKKPDDEQTSQRSKQDETKYSNLSSIYQLKAKRRKVRARKSLKLKKNHENYQR
jgi:hypothetical protein